MPQWIDYRELKREIAFTDVLEHYSIEVTINGDQAKGKCKFPNHEGEDSKSLSVNLERNVFQCFGCRAKGNVLDFICFIEGLNPTVPQEFHRAAVLAKQKFLYTPQRETPAPSPVRGKRGKEGEHSQQTTREIVNPPLDFELQGLDQERPWFTDHGFTLDTVRHFGAGYCKRGFMKDRIAIPLYDHEGQLVGYAGYPVASSKVGDSPNCLLPIDRERNGISYKFDAERILYRTPKQVKPVDQLILAGDILTTWRIWQEGYDNVVGLLIPNISIHHAEQVSDLLASSGALWICAPHDQHGDLFASEVFQRIGTRRPCRLIRYEASDDLANTLRLALS